MTPTIATGIALVTFSLNATTVIVPSLLNEDTGDSPSEDNPLNERRSYIGVLVAIIGNICISAALNIQKHVHNRLASQKTEAVSLLESDVDLRRQEPEDVFNDNEDDEVSSNVAPQHVNGLLRMRPSKTDVSETTSEWAYLKVPDWWIGMGLMTLGECGNFAAYGFAPAVLVAPLGTVALIANAIVAPIFLKENFRQRDLLGIFFAIVGTATIIVVSSQTEEPVLTPDDIASYLKQAQFIVYLIITSIYASVMAYLSPSDFGNEYIFVDLSLVAVFGGYTVLSTKAISSLLNLNFGLVFTYGITYLMLFVLVATAVLQIKYLNKSLSRFDSTQVIPTNFVLFTTSTIIGSAVLYHDFSRMTDEGILLSFVGIGSMFVGVYLITGKRRNGDDGVADEQGALGSSSRSNTPTYRRTPSRLSRTNSYAPIMVEEEDEDEFYSFRRSSLRSNPSTRMTASKAVTASRPREQGRKQMPNLSSSVPTSRVTDSVIVLDSSKGIVNGSVGNISGSRSSFHTADSGSSRREN